MKGVDMKGVDIKLWLNSLVLRFALVSWHLLFMAEVRINVNKCD